MGSEMCIRDRTFAEWAASSLLDGDDSSIDADTDGDHIPNLLEFAFGMDPVKPETTKLPRASQDFSGQNVALTYQVDRAAGGVIVRVEYVELLGQEWKDLSLAPFTSQVEILGIEGTVETRRILLPASQKIAFLRVVAEQ